MQIVVGKSKREERAAEGYTSGTAQVLVAPGSGSGRPIRAGSGHTSCFLKMKGNKHNDPQIQMLTFSQTSIVKLHLMLMHDNLLAILMYQLGTKCSKVQYFALVANKWHNQYVMSNQV